MIQIGAWVSVFLWQVAGRVLTSYLGIAETGYKWRVHCVFTGSHEKAPEDTYESCSVESTDR